MTTQPTPAFTRSLPWSLLIAPRPGLALAPGVTTAMPAAPVTFYGWGGIGGEPDWYDDPEEACDYARRVLVAVSKARRVPIAFRPSGEVERRMFVIGCEQMGRLVAADDTNTRTEARFNAYTRMLTAIYWAMKAAVGWGGEVAFSGPEDAECGDFTTPMLGARSVWNPLWETRQPLPFVSRHYRPDAARVAALLDRIAHGPGLSRGVVLWIQDYDAASQRAELEYADAVDTEYTALQAKRGGAEE